MCLYLTEGYPTLYYLSHVVQYMYIEGEPIVPLTFSLPRVTLQIVLCLTPDDFTLSNARRFCSSKGDPLGVKGLNIISLECFYLKANFQFIKQNKFFLLFFHKAPLTRTDTLTLGGSLDVKNGNGSGSVSVSAKRTLSHSSWGEVSKCH